MQTCKLCHKTVDIYSDNGTVYVVFPVCDGTTMIKDAEYIHAECFDGREDD